MKNNEEGKLEINEKNLMYYLKKEHGIDSDTLFSLKKEDYEKYHNIINHTFKDTIHYSMDDNGNLIALNTDDPNTGFKLWGYPGFDTINSLEELENHLKKALISREIKMNLLREIVGLDNYDDRSNDYGIER